jgi:quinol monooxygenase YgiN
MFTTTTKLHSRSEKRTEITQTVRELVNQIGKNTKCRRVNSYRDIEDENTFILVKDWSTMHDLDEYLSSRLFKVLLGVHPLLEYPLEMKLVTEVEKSLPNNACISSQLRN